MAIRSRLGAQNALVRRVQRHRAIATLFRSGPALPSFGNSAAALGAAGPSVRPPRQAVVIDNPDVEAIPATAELVEPRMVTVDRDLPRGPDREATAPPPQSREVQTEATPRSRPVRSSGAVAPPVRRAQTAPERESPRATLEPSRAQRDAGSEPSPIGSPEDDTTLTDQVWQRLQTIFRRHQEARETGPVPVAKSGPEQEAESEARDEDRPGEVASEPTGQPEAGSPDSGNVSPSVSEIATRPAGTLAEPAPPQRSPHPSQLLEGEPPPTHDADVDPSASSRTPAATPQGMRAQQAPPPTETVPSTTTRPEQTEDALQGPQSTTVSATASPETIEHTPVNARREPQDAVTGRVQSASLGEPETTVPRSEPRDRPTDAPRAVGHPEALLQTDLENATQAPTPPTKADEFPTLGAAEDIERQPSPTQQQPPLDQVWQVERIAPPQRGQATQPARRQRREGPTRQARDRGGSTARLAEPAPSGETEIGVTPPSQEAQPMSVDRASTVAANVLRQVAAGRPTRSSIETLAPRGPRPQLRRSQAGPTPPPSEAVGRASQAQPTTDAAQRVRRSTATRPSPDSEADGGPSETVTAAQPSTTPRSRPAAESASMVATEIGPLPGDLWDLIGEEVPDTAERIASGPPEASPEVEAAAQPAAPEETIASPVIQRSVAPSIAQAPTTTVSSGEDTTLAQTSARQLQARAQAEEGPPEAPADIDVEKLAHRVYAELKRRLTVEWERLRSL